MKQIKDLKIALVHDFLLYPGGAEKVLETLTEIFPEAPIYTLLYDRDGMKGVLEGRDIRTSYLQKFPRWLRRHHQWLIPFYPSAPETFDFRDYDLIISSSGAWVKGIVTKLNTLHVAYVHSPMRFVWDYNERYQSKSSGFLARIFLSYVRMWDFEAAQRPDYLITNSQYTQERIKKYYRRESEVIYPPAYSSSGRIAMEVVRPLRAGGSYFLIVSRLSPYKKVDLAVEVFNKLGLPLVVIGEGKQKKYLKKIAKTNVKILGWKSEQELNRYYSDARAFVFPSDDDFGITAVEAMGHGLPLIAYRKGGINEIANEKELVEFFSSQSVEVLADGVKNFIQREKEFDREKIMKRAAEFSKERFKMKLLRFIEEKVLSRIQTAIWK